MAFLRATDFMKAQCFLAQYYLDVLGDMGLAEAALKRSEEVASQYDRLMDRLFAARGKGNTDTIRQGTQSDDVGGCGSEGGPASNDEELDRGESYPGLCDIQPDIPDEARHEFCADGFLYSAWSVSLCFFGPFAMTLNREIAVLVHLRKGEKREAFGLTLDHLENVFGTARSPYEEVCWTYAGAPRLLDDFILLAVELDELDVLRSELDGWGPHYCSITVAYAQLWIALWDLTHRPTESDKDNDCVSFRLLDAISTQPYIPLVLGRYFEDPASARQHYELVRSSNKKHQIPGCAWGGKFLRGTVAEASEYVERFWPMWERVASAFSDLKTKTSAPVPVEKIPGVLLLLEKAEFAISYTNPTNGRPETRLATSCIGRVTPKYRSHLIRCQPVPENSIAIFDRAARSWVTIRRDWITALPFFDAYYHCYVDENPLPDSLAVIVPDTDHCDESEDIDPFDIRDWEYIREAEEQILCQLRHFESIQAQLYRITERFFLRDRWQEFRGLRDTKDENTASEVVRLADKQRGLIFGRSRDAPKTPRKRTLEECLVGFLSDVVGDVVFCKWMGLANAILADGVVPYGNLTLVDRHFNSHPLRGKFFSGVCRRARGEREDQNDSMNVDEGRACVDGKICRNWIMPNGQTYTCRFDEIPSCAWKKKKSGAPNKKKIPQPTRSKNKTEDGRYRCPECETDLANKHQMKQHRDRFCPFRIVDCPNIGCGRRLIASNLDEHLADECGARLVRCSRCCENVEYWDLDSEHPDICTGVEVRCSVSHECTWTGLRRDRDAHETQFCPHLRTECVWCHSRMQSFEMPQHRCPLIIAEEQQCSICACDFQELYEEKASLPAVLLRSGSRACDCEHFSLCMSCVQKWGSRKQECPYCRSTFDSAAPVSETLMVLRMQTPPVARAPPAIVPPAGAPFGGVFWVAPNKIGFTHDSIHENFRQHDKPILETMREILELSAIDGTPAQLDCLEVCWGGPPLSPALHGHPNLFVAGTGNRRLAMWRMLHSFFPERFGMVKVKVVDRDAPHVAWETKCSTTCGGAWVRVRRKNCTVGLAKDRDGNDPGLQWPEARRLLESFDFGGDAHADGRSYEQFRAMAGGG